MMFSELAKHQNFPGIELLKNCLYNDA